MEDFCKNVFFRLQWKITKKF